MDENFNNSPSDFDEQTDAFRFDLENLINRYLSEFDINAFTIMGALQEKIIELTYSGGGFEAEIEDVDDEEDFL
jgi:hypothetical protein|tara:strand:+ start:29789 stop:30010 length:222 start_codon:yes stop_codon:yes gene_type:complete